MTADANVLTDLRRSYKDLTLSQKRIAELIVEDPSRGLCDGGETRGATRREPIYHRAFRIPCWPQWLSGPATANSRHCATQMRPSPNGDGHHSSDAGHLGEGTIAKSLIHDSENLRATIARLSVTDLEHAVAILLRARWIYVAGGFASEALAKYVSVHSLDSAVGSVS